MSLGKSLLGLLDTDGKAATILQNIRNYSPSDTILHLRRLESSFLNEFTKLQKVTMRFVTPVCLSICMEQLSSH
jgi:hypothetical protein